MPGKVPPHVVGVGSKEYLVAYGWPIDGAPLVSRDEVAARLRSAGCVRAEDEAELLCTAARTPQELHGMIEARVAGTPIEHLLGWAEFHGVRVVVEPGVFVPRHRSDALVDAAIARTRPGAMVLDLCCGSGALGLALCAAVPSIDLHATDVDPIAVRCARASLASCQASVSCGDLFDAVPVALLGRFDVIVANAPYVPTAAIPLMPVEARLFEAAVALDGGADGLNLHRRIAAECTRWLAVGGVLLVEVGLDQASACVDLFTSSGLCAYGIADAECAVVIGRRRP